MARISWILYLALTFASVEMSYSRRMVTTPKLEASKVSEIVVNGTEAHNQTFFHKDGGQGSLESPGSYHWTDDLKFDKVDDFDLMLSLINPKRVEYLPEDCEIRDGLLVPKQGGQIQFLMGKFQKLDFSKMGTGRMKLSQTPQYETWEKLKNWCEDSVAELSRKVHGATTQADYQVSYVKYLKDFEGRCENGVVKQGGELATRIIALENILANAEPWVTVFRKKAAFKKIHEAASAKLAELKQLCSVQVSEDDDSGLVKSSALVSQFASVAFIALAFLQ